MGIASGIFWIVFGLLFILYQAFKEHPTETVTGIVICAIIICALYLFYTIFDWLLDKNVFLAAVFFVAVFGTIAVKVGSSMVKDAREKEKRIKEYNAHMKKVRDTMTEADYEEYARRSCYRFGANMNKDSIFYWKNEPYFTKIAEAAEMCQSIKMSRLEAEREGMRCSEGGDVERRI